MSRVKASCLCGAVRFSVAAPVGPITACHCTQCRKLSGHYSASFDVDAGEIQLTAKEGIREYRTPGGGIRAFCGTCGAKLWFRDAGGALSVEAGSIDGATGASLAEHIFAAHKGDYYDIAAGVPQYQEQGTL